MQLDQMILNRILLILPGHRLCISLNHSRLGFGLKVGLFAISEASQASHSRSASILLFTRIELFDGFSRLGVTDSVVLASGVGARKIIPEKNGLNFSRTLPLSTNSPRSPLARSSSPGCRIHIDRGIGVGIPPFDGTPMASIAPMASRRISRLNRLPITQSAARTLARLASEFTISAPIGLAKEVSFPYESGQICWPNPQPKDASFPPSAIACRRKQST